MKAENDRPIPIPLRQRLRDLRLHFAPVLVFGGALAVVAYLWKDNIAAPTLVAQAEPVVAQVSSYKGGMLAELSVTRFQKVKAGDCIGRVVVTDPKILESSLSVIRSEIEMLRVNLKPIATQQRTAMDFNQMRLDWMRDRAQLASGKVNLQLAESEYRRVEDLYQDKIVSQRSFEEAKAAFEKRRDEVAELGRLVSEAERSVTELQSTNVPEITKVSTDPVVASIAVQEAKLKLTEAELSPIQLKAPMDGIVTMVLRRSGESVTAGQPIVSIATFSPVRIVGYMRAPIFDEPKPGMRVEVRTRGFPREVGRAEIKEVGTQMEPVPLSLMGPAKLTGVDLGLPVEISLPANLPIRAGELVDVVFLSKAQ